MHNSKRDLDKFEEAFRETSKSYPCINKIFGITIVRDVRLRLYENRTKGVLGTFHSDLDASIKSYNLTGRERAAYKSLAGRYFSPKKTIK